MAKFIVDVAKVWNSLSYLLSSNFVILFGTSNKILCIFKGELKYSVGLEPQALS